MDVLVFIILAVTSVSGWIVVISFSVGKRAGYKLGFERGYKEGKESYNEQEYTFER